MRAIALTQPWAWAVAYAGRTIVDRPDAPPADLSPDEIIAIVAGRGWNARAFEWLRAHALALGIPVCPPRGEHYTQRVVAVARVSGVLDPDPAGRNGRKPGALGWSLTDVARLPDPVETRGQPGVFVLTDGAEGSARLSLLRWRTCLTCSLARAQRSGPRTCEHNGDPSMRDAGGCFGWRGW